MYALLHDAGYEDGGDVAVDLVEHHFVRLLLASRLFSGDELVVLCRNHDGVDALRMSVVVVFDGHLALRVGAEVAHHLTLASDVSEYNHDVVCKRERQRHVAVGLVVGISEHHALVAGALVHGVGTLHAAVDVGAL